MVKFQCEQDNNSPSWTLWDLIRWLLPINSEKTGDPLLNQYKAAWVIRNSKTIIKEAAANDIPDTLLAGVCWKEAGGDPDFIDVLAHTARSFDHMGPDYIDKKLTILKPPEKTSYGAVSMQLRVAAKTLGYDIDKLTALDRHKLGRCLEKDVFNIYMVAKHLRELVNFDKLQTKKPFLDETSFKVAATRYQRGIKPKLEDIKKDMHYGSVIYNNIDYLRKLLDAKSY